MWSIIRRKQNKKGEEGFTLIELIVVIAILGFLLALAIPRYTSSRLEAAKKSTQANLHNLANAVELYMTEIPTTTVPAYNSGIFSKYIPKAPKPPVGTNAYQYYVIDSDSYCIWDPNQIGNSFFYVSEGGIITESGSAPGYTGSNIAY